MATNFTRLLTFLSLLFVTCQGVKGKCPESSCTKQGEICVGIKYGRPVCICQPKCKIKVPAIELRYMCGSDGYFYRNLCDLDRTACLLGIKIQPLYMGKCVRGSLHVSIKHQTEQNFTVGSRVELNCKFIGSPQKVEWSKKGVRGLPSSARVRGMSLEFSKISEDDAGTYVCRASDASGKQASTTIDVIIKVPKLVNPSKPPTQPNQCIEPPTYGKCAQVLVRWYFNREQKVCLPFVYSGCNGNRNRFDSKEICEESCAAGVSAGGDVCPEGPKPSHSCPLDVRHQCSKDNDCQKGLKCCLSGCVKECVPAVAKVKPGKCPRPTLDTVECDRDMTDECQNDRDCDGDRKCCIWATGCELVCMEPVKQVNKCKRIIDLAFVLDSSGSIRPQEWPQVIKFVKKVLENFDVSKGGTHVGVISYSTNSHLHFRFNTIKGKHRAYEDQNLVNEIPRLRGYTFPYKALAMANNELFFSRGGMRETARKVMIMLIHGKQTTTQGPVMPLDVASKPLKDKGVEIWAIGIGNGVSQNELRDIATDPSKTFAVGSFSSIFGIIDKIVPNICNETNLSACQKEYRNSIKTNSTFIPRCTSDGSYSNMQCRRHVCYCVDKQGQQIQGTETRIEAGKPRCSRADKKLTDCQRAYAQAIASPELGQHIPRCKTNGNYEEVQCEGSTGECWCVNIRGQMLPGTKTNRALRCPPHSDSNKLLTDCQRRYFEVSRNPAPTHYLPWCTPEGNYRWLQCHDSYCFCVNKNGHEIPRTRLRSEAGLPNCTAGGAILTPCQREHIKYGDRFFYPGRYSPTCKPDGRYEEVQCHPSIGTCWCVDSDGYEISGTKKWGPVSCTTPEKPLTACQKQYQASQRNRIKVFSPWCDDAGRFEAMQCFGPECYCVDSNGATIEGTLVSIVQGRPDCKQPTKEQKRTHCQIASEGGVRIGVELHYHKCTWYGMYERIQCQPFSRQCWCVNSNGEELVGTRSSEIVSCPVIGGHLPRCQLEYQEKNKQWYLEGRFVPWCSIDGNYQPYQCHRSHCYCVSKEHGVEAYRSRMEISRGDAVCSPPVSESECEGKRKAALSSGLYGSYKPQCKPDGNFHEVQCHGSFCFCVNQRGVQIPETSVPIGSKPQCQNIAMILSPCERAVQASLYRKDAFVPRCSNDGQYQDVQCNVSSCWCVDKDGQEILGTRTNGIVTCPGKGAYSSPCWKEYQSKARQPNSLGRYVPDCNLDGSYMKVQCHRSYCFCVDANGAELRGFSVNAGLYGKPVCKNTDAEKTDCQKKRIAALMANPSVVPLLPECKPDGSYSDVQCDWLSDECWCADAEGNEVKGTRTNGTLRCASRKTDNETLCGRSFFTRSGPVIGLWNHMAVCQVNGVYRPIQCDGRKGYCWCVKENGKPRWNTVTRSLPDCNVEDGPTNCQEHRTRLLGISGSVRRGIYIPQCKKNGDYEQIQCHAIEGVQYCWCVDALGIEMPNTRQRSRPRNCLPKPDESQCRLQVQEALRTEVTKGRFVPRCQSNGDFEEVQCNEWTGYCWCVDRSGKEIKNTRTKDFVFCPGLGRDLTNCQREYQEAERDKFTVGRFMPRCTPKGEYVPVQCHESECYCVNYYGREIYGSRLRMPARPNCTNAASGQTECQYSREAVLANTLPGAPIPQCTSEGGYDKVQCTDFFCYCVDMRGKEIPGTKLAIADGKPKCDNPALKLSLCQRQYQEYWRNPISGRYVPLCDSKGQFEPVQCYGSYCFCVDMNGIEKQGTRVMQTLQTTDCSNSKKPLTPCQALLAKQTLERPKPGQVIPRCASDGSFFPVQCDSLSKECWCVNSTNYEIPGTRKKGFVQCGQDPKGMEPKCNSQSSISHFKKFSPACQSNNGFQPLQCDFRYGYCWCSDVNGNMAPTDVVRGRANCPNLGEVPVCKIHRLRVLGPTGVAQSGAFIPQCFEDGNYDRVQCDGSSSFCWCVDENGFEEPGSREFGRPNCEEKIGHTGQLNGLNKRIEAPCHQARQRVLGLSEVPSPGVFIPECETDGSFKPVQCHSSTGFCWCVDQYGQERTGTRTPGNPQCGPMGNLTACHRDRMRAFGWNGRFIVGLMIPRCRPDGSFEPQQCQESTGQCWCVDENGNELYGTRSSGQITCSLREGITSCQNARQTSVDVYNPFDCENSGGYSPKQCSIGNGEPRQCWCVDRNGKEIPRTRTTGGINCDDISAGLTRCQRERQIALGWSGVARADAFVPDCTADGGYEKIQCHETTGLCWCVDGNGNEMVETRMRGRPVCERKVSRSPCLMERQRALGWSRNHNGAFVPQCRDNGRYDLVQCHHRTCWCVDEFGYELPGTRRESGTPDCNTRPAYFTPCYQWRTRVIGNSPSSVLSRGVFVPECDSSGTFVKMQCSISTGYCWCVDVHGGVLADTYTRGQVDCDNRGSLTKCQKERTDALAAKSKDSKSQTFVPSCAQNGGYKPEQCDTSLGECWCVNHLGNEESGTRVKAQGIVCELQAGLTACQKEQRRAYGFVDQPPNGRFVPKCKPDGSYDDVQCQKSGYCWCVDLEGIEILGTRRKGKPLCYAAARLSNCQTERELTLGPNKIPLPGQFVPKCRKDGSYAEIQCDRSVGECWCVDHDGLERTGTRQIGKPVDCYEEVFSLCRRERHRALGWTGLHVPNLFVPECKLDGTYETIQCHLATKYCWCVDRWGHEWPGTRVKGTPDCKKAIGIGKDGFVSAMPTSCQMDQWRALIWSEQFDSIYGVFSPDCTPDGRYLPVQCNTHTSYCWCVDDRGNEIWGTRVRGNRPDCNSLDTNTTTCSKSATEGDNLQRINFYFGRFVPKCDSHGGYEPIQCDQSGYCWCVDRYGQELPRTKVKGIPQTCGLLAGTTSCQRESYIAMTLGGNPTPGRYKAECDRDGRYKRVQCDKMSRYCWCVDENGIEIPRSQVARGRPSCGSMAIGLAPCRVERFRSLPWVNKFAPRCNDDGSYPQHQCFGAYCWCVDKNGNEIARTRTREKFSCSFILPKDYETTCQYRQRKAQSNSVAEFTPVCDRLGGYHPVQCLEGSPYCWCVDKYGIEIPRTRSKTVPQCHYQAGLTMCQKERQIAIGWTGIAAPGQFLPKCRADGSYDIVQCHASTGFCWCVDKDGNELSGTRRKGTPMCLVYVTLRPCLNERERALGPLGEAPPGRFVPSCTASGGYLPTQCHQSIGYCWCVDNAGREIPNTRRKGKAYCEEQETISTCNMELYLANAMSVPTAFYPSCEQDGNYKEIQCRFSPGKSCWCVDENGNAIAGTETNGRPNCTNGEIKYTQCKLERFNSLVRRLNQVGNTDVIFVPQCKENGGYDEIQCYRGQCWCVNHRGVEIPGTRTRGRPYCQIPVCIQERMNALSYNKMPVRFVPKCKKDGNYADMQCHSATGYCWCADELGREIPETRVRGKPICGVKDGALTICQRQRKLALRSITQGPFIPRCNHDGSFAPIQCYETDCYCVDKDGEEIQASRVKLPLKPDCKKINGEKKLLGEKNTNCIRQYHTVMDNFAISRFIPQCLPNGTYQTVQCDEGWYSCWCVDSSGNELLGTRTTGWPTCPQAAALPTNPTQCQREYRAALDGYIYGRYVPRCQPDGNYEPMQCHSSLCFCVNKYGVEIDGTREPGLKPLKCKTIDPLTKCQKQYRDMRSNYPLGTVVPRCLADGSFALVQCGPSRFCWCVDEEGREVINTRSRGWPACGKKEKQVSQCHKEFRATRLNSSSNACAPLCQPDTGYEPMQCHAGTCFCVDKMGKEIRGTATPLPKIPKCLASDSLMSPCQRLYELALQRHVLSRWIPNCRPDGTFDTVQCDRGWYCWCVDEDGKELPGTRKRGWPECGVQEKNPGHCRKLYVLSLKQLVPGRFIPRCRPDGSFDPVQCFGSVCMCVDRYGVEVPGTTKPRFNEPDCAPLGWTLTPCQRHYQEAHRFGDVNQFVPTCDLKGLYDPVQCYGNICFCVDENGIEMLNTRTHLPKKPVCSRNTVLSRMPCMKENAKAIQNTDKNVFVPRCRDDGSYREIQCRGMTCHCVDSNGIKKRKTITPRPLRPDCYGSLPSKCQQQYLSALSNYQPGRYIPRCESTGSFASIQQQNGFSHCVDKDGQEILGTATLIPFNPRCEIIGAPDRPRFTPSRCPLIFKDSNSCTKLPHQCERDIECPEDKKCCFDGCNNVCMDGIPEKLADTCSKSLDLAIGIYSSPNVTRCSWIRILDFLKRLASQFHVSPGKVNIGVISYDSNIKVENDFKSLKPSLLNVEEIQRIIGNVALRKGNGKLDKTLESIEKQLFNTEKGMRTKSIKMLLLTEDGTQSDSSNQETLRQVSKRLKNKGVNIIALSVDGNAKKNALSVLVSSPDNIFEKSLVNLNEAIRPLAKSLCLEDKCKKVFDIAIVVDASDSIGRSNWFRKKQFIKRILSGFRIRQDGVHVAIIVYSNDAEVILKFNTLQGGNLNEDQVLKKIDLMEWRKGFTFIDKALDLADKEVFVTAAGMRTDVQKVLLVMTDGKQSRDQAPFTEPHIIAERIKGKGVMVYSVGIGNIIDEEELKSIASDSNKVVLAESFGALQDVAGNIRNVLCKGTTTRDGTCPRNWKALFSRKCDGRPDGCQSDSDCPSPMKCCSSGCHKQCVVANQAFAPTAFAVCEADQTSGIIYCKCEECTNTTDSVCGSNNKTYPNECMMRQDACKKNKTISVKNIGACGTCPRNWKGLFARKCDGRPDGCKSDNDCPIPMKCCSSGCHKQCVLANQALAPAAFAVCEADHVSGIIDCKCEECPVTTDPICGSNNKTYPNECMMRQDACKKNKTISVKKEGACGTCPRNWKRLFGRKCDGRPDGCQSDSDCPLPMKCCSSGCHKQCVMVNQALAPAAFAVCEADQISGIIDCKCEECSNINDPVCGSNNKTYPNECMMRQDACKKNKTISVKKEGACGTCPRKWKRLFGRECDGRPDQCISDSDCPPKLKCCSSGCHNQCVKPSQAFILPAFGMMCEAHQYTGIISCKCEECPENTTDLVCGSNNKTYPNECMMRQDACKKNTIISVQKKGVCDPCINFDCSSPPYSFCEVDKGKAVCSCRWKCAAFGFSWVCGSDGNSYKNECEMRQAACTSNKMITVRRKGHCNACYKYECKSPPYSRCTVANGKPVCSCRWNCSDAANWVCGSDGNSYKNECEMRRAACTSNQRITIGRKGHCNPCFKYQCSTPPYSTCTNANDKPVCACRFECSAAIDYVCGSDGNTYDNECQMRRAACRSNKTITMGRKGHCDACFNFDCSLPPYSLCKANNGKAECVCPSQCPLNVDHVCGSDGNTYDNECQMRQAACRSNKMITVRRKRHCDPCFKYKCSSPPYSTCTNANDKAVCACSFGCSTIIDSVCGSDGNTYDNECQMRRAACRRNKTITVRRKGHCDVCFEFDCSSPPYSSCKANNGKAECVCQSQCPLNIDYVCGSDGNTYDNECQMRQAACRNNKLIKVHRKGHCDPCYKFNCQSKPYSSCKANNGKAECVCPSQCPLNIDYVCGSDGNTYDNECKMRQAACRSNKLITVRRKGHCDPCYKFNCQSKPYSSCEVANDRAECVCPSQCPLTTDYVCGSDGNTYDNECQMRQAACRSNKMITVRRKGHCDPCFKYQCSAPPYSTCTNANDKAVCACRFECSTTVNYVCGSDGNTYDNECQMRQAACRSSKLITVRSKGHCDPCHKFNCQSKPYSSCEVANEGAECVCPSQCPLTTDYVCGSDGKTYDNECQMKQAACRSNKMITVRRKGHCDPCFKYQCSSPPYSTCTNANDKAVCACRFECSTTVNYVCGSDGNTYDNECQMRQAACRSSKLITVRSKGHCDPCYKFNCQSKPYSSCEVANEGAECVCPSQCPLTTDYVCGSDGNTYDNECQMKQAACRSNKMITVRRKGHCDPCFKYQCSSPPYSTCTIANDKAVCACRFECSTTVDYVCGSDGNTYDNECQMRRAACRSNKTITVRRKGHCDACFKFDCSSPPYSSCKAKNGKAECVCPSQCPLNIDYVCGSDGNTYDNQCQMRQAACRSNKMIIVRRKRHCDPCYKFNCQSKPYSSCEVTNDRAECVCPSQCPLTTDYVCGSDGKTYDNECQMKQAACRSNKMITVRRKGHCDPCFKYQCSSPPYSTCTNANDKAVCACRFECSTTVNYVCGSDGNTYDNECQMRRAACRSNKTITVRRKGHCDDCFKFDCSSPPYSSCKAKNGKAECVCQSQCPLNIDDVCGSDGNTYDNECQMRQAACRNNKLITVRSKGHCDPCYKFNCQSKPYSSCEVANDRAECVCPSQCPLTTDYVCGSDGKTYDNECQMKQAACRSNKMITVRRKGHCDPCFKYQCSSPPYSTCTNANDKAVCACRFECSTTVNYVCGSDGNTYDNECQMRRAACRSNKTITVRRKGHCDACFKFDCSSPPYSSCKAKNGKAECVCPSQCPLNIDDVCGSDGNTYDNECQMRQAACRNNKLITVRSKGHCDPCYKFNCQSKPYSSCEVANDRAECVCPSQCPLTTDYVCGSDGKTYDNECQMRQAACRSNKMITVRRKGHCDPCFKYQCSSPPYSTCTNANDKAVCACRFECSTTVNYVCGSDGNTYDNECQMRRAACRSNKTITVRRIGHCDACFKFDCSSPPYSSCKANNGKAECVCPSQCPLNIDDVCGSDGNTYDNECQMRQAACRSNKLITVRRKGHCDPCYKFNCQSKPYSSCKANNGKAECVCPSQCPLTTDYVCGSDGNTYDNECQMRQAACRSNKMITVRRKGHCDPCFEFQCSFKPYLSCKTVNDKAVCACPETCPTRVDLVCGNDSNVYDNECLMRQASCRKGIMITVRRKGHCNPCIGYNCALVRPFSTCKVVEDQAKCVCPVCEKKEPDYACYSNGIHYRSECSMRRASCALNETLTLVSKGKCVCNAIVDLGFLVDSSGSIGRKNWSRMKEFVNSVIKSFKVGRDKTHVATISYSTEPEVVFDFNTLSGSSISAEAYANYINGMRWQRGYTYIDKALLLANKNLFNVKNGMRVDVPKILLVITDGIQTKRGKFTPLAEASRYVKQKGVRVYAMGIGKSVAKDELQDIASNRNRDVFLSDSFQLLKPKVQEIIDKVCYPDPCDTYVCTKPYSVCELDDESPACICPKECPKTSEPVCGSDDLTYRNPCLLKKKACETNKVITVAERNACKCKIAADLVFVVDSSGSIGRRNWNRMKEFLNKIISEFQVGEDETHVAMVAYSSSATVEFNFNTLTGPRRTAQEYAKLVNAMRWQRGYTFIDKGIAKANQEVLTAVAGMRENVDKIFMVITDGIQTKDREAYTPLGQAILPVKQKGFRVYSIGIGSNIEVNELKQVASDSEKNFFSAPSFKELTPQVRIIMEQLCSKGHGARKSARH